VSAGSTARRAAFLLALLVACGDGSGGSPDAASGPDATPADAGPPSCNLPVPGTACKDSHTLEYCNGDQVAEMTCGGASLCGPDPAQAGGAACVAAGDACGMIDFLGACEGDVLAWCSSGTLVVGDCAANYGVCTFIDQSTGYNCTTPCAQMGVTAEGTCVGADIMRCDFDTTSGYHVVTDACPANTACGMLAQTGWPACIPTGACASVGPEGRCSGNTLTSCVGGAPTTTDCAAAGGVCTYGGAGVGYACATAGAMGAFKVSGTVRYEDRPPMPDGSLGPIGQKPARGVSVAVVNDADGAVLAAGVTADDGSYALSYDQAAAGTVHVLAATVSTVSARPRQVIRPDGLTHGLGGASFQPAADGAADLLVTDASGESEAFNVFDQLLVNADLVTGTLGDATPEPLTAVWVRGGTDGTYYVDADNTMFLLGDPGDDDGYDDTVILHESGHYIEDTEGRSDSTGGSHDGSPADARLAWSEGFSTYFSMVATNAPIYMDSNASGGWSYNGDTAMTLAPMPMGTMAQDVSEDMVTEILWDLGDDGASDDDAYVSVDGHGPVLLVQPLYLRTQTLRNVGVTGVDLVDFLDGWFVRGGLGSCAAVRAIVTGTHKFPYDYAGPAGVCP
jgi:hypothetical protein